MDTSRRVSRLVDELALDEKVRLVHGAVDPEGRATGYVPGVDRLGVPPLRMVDGPLGVRVPGESATAFPAPLALAATFDTGLAREHGAALGRETRGMGADALLGPGVNLIRVPHGGRNFEYFAEDPLLSASFAASVVDGVESEDVIATPKHYVANNQETGRASVSAEVSERALRELYLPSFRAAVEAGAGSVMTAYNAVNGTRMSDHRRLVREVLKDEWGFDGYVVSDWFGTEAAAAAANGGLDLEMPGVTMAEMGGEDGAGGAEAADAGDADAGFDVPEEFARGMPDPRTCERFGDALADAVESGAVPEARLDDMVARVLGGLERTGQLDGERGADDARDEGAVDTPGHRALASRVAARGTVLLENDGLLPLDADADVAVVGPNVDEAVLGGGGSSETTPVVETSPREGMAARAEGDVTVARGLPRVEAVSMLDALTGGADESDDADPGSDDAGSTREPDVEDAAAAARDADAAVVFVRDTATEAMDRGSLRLPDRQDELVSAVAAANDRTAVVVNSSGPVELPWREEAAAVVENWYPGQAHGESVAAVLYGDADPGGRLPVTFAPEGSYPVASDRRFPGVDGEAHYEEGVFVGYRWFDAAGDDPTYPFGHGLSYADFAYADPETDGESVEVTVENAADCDGREVVQAYVRPPETEGVDRPVRGLAGFESLELDAGERTRVTVDLDDRAFRHYDPDDGWTVAPGRYGVEVGRSARDVRAETNVTR